MLCQWMLDTRLGGNWWCSLTVGYAVYKTNFMRGPHHPPSGAVITLPMWERIA
jgi:hypothetical protein